MRQALLRDSQRILLRSRALSFGAGKARS